MTARAGKKQIGQGPSLEKRARARQRARLLQRLRAAAGEPVGFAELREAGIAFPVKLASELELEGMPLERCYRDSGEARMVFALRLEPERDPWGLVEGLGPERPAMELRRGTRAKRIRPARARWLVTMALVAVVGAVGVVVLMALDGAGGGSRLASRPSPAKAYRGTGSPIRQRPSTESPSALRHVPVSPSLAARLDGRASDLLAAGRFGRAASLSRKALAASGKGLAGCVQPKVASCLTYAGALVDLGRALRLGGNATAAVLVLERRLQIKLRRPAVDAELRQAVRESR